MMATSKSFDFSVTTNEIIELAYKIVNALPEGQVLTNEQFDTGKKMLNMMVKSWRSRNILLWQTDHITVPLTASSIILGSDGVDYECIKNHTAMSDNKPITGSQWVSFWKKLNTTNGSTWVSDASYTSVCNPILDSNIIDIEDGIVRLISSETNNKMTKIPRSEYINRFDSNSTSQPNQYYFKKEQTPSVFLNPYPDSAINYVVEFSAYRYPEDFDGGDDNPDFLIEWNEAMVFGLAERLAFQNGIFGSDLKDIQQRASRSLDEAQQNDHETGSIFIRPRPGR